MENQTSQNLYKITSLKSFAHHSVVSMSGHSCHYAWSLIQYASCSNACTFEIINIHESIRYTEEFKEADHEQFTGEFEQLVLNRLIICPFSE